MKNFHRKPLQYSTPYSTTDEGMERSGCQSPMVKRHLRIVEIKWHWNFQDHYKIIIFVIIVLSKNAKDIY